MKSTNLHNCPTKAGAFFFFFSFLTHPPLSMANGTSVRRVIFSISALKGHRERVRGASARRQHQRLWAQRHKVLGKGGGSEALDSLKKKQKHTNGGNKSPQLPYCLRKAEKRGGKKTSNANANNIDLLFRCAGDPRWKETFLEWIQPPHSIPSTHHPQNLLLHI